MKIVDMLWYPKCSTCQKAKAFLEENGVEIRELRDIKTQNPSEEEIRFWKEKGNLPLKKFFNTSGILYKELNLKEKLQSMPESEQINLLSTDGMLVKRPILVTEKSVLVGFRAAEWEAALI